MSYTSEIIKRWGRPPKIKSAKHLGDLFAEYVEFSHQHPIELPQTIVKGNNKTEGRGGKVERPLTLQGFMAFVGLGYTWSQFKERYSGKEAFASVITRIETSVRSQQIEGGLAGVYNSNLTARLNGLTDKQDVTSQGKRVSIVIGGTKTEDEE